MVFESLDWWWDPVPRKGPEAMAIDEWLLGSVERPTLRVYGWDGAWGSVGYFGNLVEAMEQIPGRQWVRRWTGGGVVDHTHDWTYTVVIPAGEVLARSPSAVRYRMLHEALAGALAGEGVKAQVASDAVASREALCFHNPVPFDLLDGRRKLAGAGQRRTRRGVLHQGSVAGKCGERQSLERAECLARCLCPLATRVEVRLPDADVLAGYCDRYR